MSDALLSTTIPAIFTSFQRSRIVLHPRYALLKINNVESRESAKKYIKNVVHYRWTNKEGEEKENYGIIKGVHGNKGMVRVLFERNLPPKALGSIVRVKLYKAENDQL